MYVFTSAIFFLIIFSFEKGSDFVKLNDPDKQTPKEGIKDWEKEKANLEKNLKKETDEDEKQDIQNDINTISVALAEAKKDYGDTTTRKFDKKEKALLIVNGFADSVGLSKAGFPNLVGTLKKDSADKGGQEDGIHLSDKYGGKFKTVASYDSAQEALPPFRQDGLLKKFFKRRLITINEEFRTDKSAYLKHIGEDFMHSFPKILFFSLPFFALILKVVYIRRRQYFYVDHGIFTIHLYCATFIFLLLLTLSYQLGKAVSWPWLHTILGIVDVVIWIYICIYLYKAMRGFYKQRRIKTFLKYLIVGFLAFIFNFFLMILFLIISAISV